MLINIGKYPLTVGTHADTLVDTRLGDEPRYFITPSKDINMRVPDEIRQCVIYLGSPTVMADGRDAMRPRGTGFFVSIPLRIEGSNTAYIYLVTAKHVADSLGDKPFKIRINTNDGRSMMVNSGDSLTWWTHPTESTVDVAVFPWAPSRELYEYKSIPQSMLLTDAIIQSKSIGTGDEVFMTGLFIHLAGNARNLPIVRMGNIAMMPQETVPTRFGDIDAYLIEARSIGGLSGSPAFVRETVNFGLGTFYLLGLMHGHWDIPPNVRDDSLAMDADDFLGKVNLGIAVVIPAKKILEVLNHPGLVEMRKNNDEKIRKENMPTMDGITEHSENESAFTEDAFEETLRQVSQRVESSEPGEASSQT